jgi:cathepsin B
MEVVPDAAIEYINSVQNMWTASKNWVGKMTKLEAKRFANVQRLPYSEYPEEFASELTVTPWNFDSRSAWYGCVNQILDQGQCGSCWAFAATEALSDRFCIASQGKVNPVLSPQYLVSCDSSNFGCNGGYLSKAWAFMEKGVPSYSCVNYTATDSDCSSVCDDGSKLTLYKATNIKAYKGPKAIQQAILTDGPVETGFDVYDDFFAYSGGIYSHTYGGLEGGHAVKIVGWGNYNGTNYWTCANSWGNEWGVQGFFYIAFGECGIDDAAYAGTPVL